jgi:phosphoribosylformylglycinamidine synthase
LLKIPPVLLISVFGKIPNVIKTASADFKRVGSTIVLVGKPDTKNLGGTTYFDVTKSASEEIPFHDLKTASKVLFSITNAIKKEKALAVHDISEGGLAAALAEMCFGGNCGADIDLKTLTGNPKIGNSQKMAKVRPDYILFNETPATFIVEVENPKIARELFGHVPHFIIGKTQNTGYIVVNQGKKRIAKVNFSKLKDAWQKPMKEVFHDET